jgi:hypothetical protein
MLNGSASRQHLLSSVHAGEGQPRKWGQGVFCTAANGIQTCLASPSFLSSPVRLGHSRGATEWFGATEVAVGIWYCGAHGLGGHYVGSVDVHGARATNRLPHHLGRLWYTIVRCRCRNTPWTCHHR